MASGVRFTPAAPIELKTKKSPEGIFFVFSDLLLVFYFDAFCAVAVEFRNFYCEETMFQ